MLNLQQAAEIFLKIKEGTVTEDEKLEYDLFIGTSCIKTEFLMLRIEQEAKTINLNE